MNNDYTLYVYSIGCVIAFILGCIDAYRHFRKGEDISDFPAVISVITLISWIYVLMFLKDLYQEKHSST
jgi:ATP/ADP translocase